MRSTHSLRNSQAGASLIVALVFLLVLTVAGIAAVNTATNEERMASSSQFRGTTYQWAQSEAQAHLLRFNANVANRAPLLLALDANPATTAEKAAVGNKFPDLKVFSNLVPQTAASGLTQTSRTRHMANIDCVVLGLGDSAGEFECRQYEINVRSSLNNGAFSDQTRGLYFINLKSH